MKSPRGAKSEIIVSTVKKFSGPFHISDVQRECPVVSLDLIRRVLKDLRSSGEVECLGRGQNAKWQRKEKEK